MLYEMSSGQPSESSLSRTTIFDLDDGHKSDTFKYSHLGIPVAQYLELPETKELLASITKDKSGKSASTSGQPVPLGEARSSHHVVELQQLCQREALISEFDIVGHSQGWGGALRLGDLTVSSGKKFWPTKKAAKEALAELGLDALQGKENLEGAPVKDLKDAPEKLWASMLYEFYNRSVGTGVNGPVYMEYAVGSFFACTCTIPARPMPFGSTSMQFSSKKGARNNAAMEAMKFLIAEGLATADGKDPSKTEKNTVRLDVILTGTSYAQRINELCPILGVPLPKYVLAPNPHAPVSNILSGAAYFPPNPLLSGPFGEVRNVFGKKNAKEQCAKELFRVLMEIAKEKNILNIMRSGDGQGGGGL